MTTSRFHLTLPAQTANLQLVRLMVATLASDLLSVAEIEDIKVAIEELTAVTIQPSEGGANLHLDFLVATGSLTVHGRRELSEDVQLVAHDFYRPFSKRSVTLMSSAPNQGLEPSNS